MSLTWIISLESEDGIPAIWDLHGISVGRTNQLLRELPCLVHSLHFCYSCGASKLGRYKIDS